MAKDMLDKIRQAENENISLINAANQNAKDQIAQAHKNADIAIEKAKADAAQDAKEAAKKAAVSAADILASAQKQAQADCDALSITAEKNRQNTIERVIDCLFK